MFKQSKVAIIIVNFNGYEDTVDCLNSLYEIDYSNYEIILVDNNSIDKRILNINNIFPDVKLIALTENKGFAGANNVALRYIIDNDSNVEYILLLNNDTIVQKDFLLPLVETVKLKNEKSACCPLIYYHDRKDIVWFAGGKINWKIGKTYHQNEGKPISQITNNNFDFLTGCALFFPKIILEKVGMMDEDYFLYFEDVAYSLEMRNKGYELIVVPNSIIWHKVSSSTGFRSPLSNYYGTRNNIIFMKNYSKNLLFFNFLFTFTMKNIIKIIIYLLMGKVKVPKAIIKSYIDFFSAHTGKSNIENI